MKLSLNHIIHCRMTWEPPSTVFVGQAMQTPTVHPPATPTIMGLHGLSWKDSAGSIPNVVRPHIAEKTAPHWRPSLDPAIRLLDRDIQQHRRQKAQNTAHGSRPIATSKTGPATPHALTAVPPTTRWPTLKLFHTSHGSGPREHVGGNPQSS